MLNKWIGMGRITKDLTLKYTSSNLPAISFDVAVERQRKGSDGQRKTDFISCVAFGKTAEFVSQWFSKGKLIIVAGSVQTRSYTDKNGQNRTATEVVADEVMFGEGKRDDGGKAQGRNDSDVRYPDNFYPNPDIDDDDELPF